MNATNSSGGLRLFLDKIWKAPPGERLRIASQIATQLEQDVYQMSSLESFMGHPVLKSELPHLLLALQYSKDHFDSVLLHPASERNTLVKNYSDSTGVNLEILVRVLSLQPQIEGIPET